ncbi:hypothetical protein KSB_35120 [Ktedonobacter robiniae]|uniref:Uncharacterized protein n=1 Tax=Ktedonobacter robiniae TaxID=2778365 RepID=A0ABQ3UQZ6_9CHLR|nr:hypothetical protein KSB_35120 [Ktedonobacter robiniae]
MAMFRVMNPTFLVMCRGSAYLAFFCEGELCKQDPYSYTYTLAIFEGNSVS